jgi:hypothetical protein
MIEILLIEIRTDFNEEMFLIQQLHLHHAQVQEVVKRGTKKPHGFVGAPLPALRLSHAV